MRGSRWRRRAVVVLLGVLASAAIVFTSAWVTSPAIRGMVKATSVQALSAALGDPVTFQMRTVSGPVPRQQASTVLIQTTFIDPATARQPKHEERTKLCSGAFISEDVVLTAAHCLTPFEPTLERVRLTVSPAYTIGGDGQVRQPLGQCTVTRTWSDPEFSDYARDHDWALLLIDTCDLIVQPGGGGGVRMGYPGVLTGYLRPRVPDDGEWDSHVALEGRGYPLSQGGRLVALSTRSLATVDALGMFQPEVEVGMSGGPVVDADNRVLGVIVGRVPGATMVAVIDAAKRDRIAAFSRVSRADREKRDIRNATR